MALEGKLAAIYTDLWTMNPKTFCLYAPPEHFPDRETALFMTHLKPGRPGDYVAIWVSRMPVPDDDDEPDLGGATTDELISLAHERGHEASYLEGTYVPTTMPEERRAWKFAEDKLRALGFGDWARFEKEKEFSLAEHQRRGTPE